MPSITYEEVFDLEELPNNLLVLSAGPVIASDFAFAQACRGLRGAVARALMT